MSAKPGRFLAIALIPFALAIAGCQTTTDSGTAGGPVATASPAPDVSDLVGAQGSAGEMALQERGFIAAVTGGPTTYWWNAASRTCVEVVTGDGRYQSVTPVAAGSCGF